MSFNDIIGQERVLAILSNTIKSNKIAHAYIFAGNNSVGKKKTAVEFAKILNCLESTGNISCENCRNCKKIQNNIHPEIKIYNSENKNISIDEIKSIQKDIQYKNVESKYRFIIIENADKFTQEAANCFLKTLEEPPVSTIIILLVNSVSSLLKTIISRCQIIKFKELTNDEKIMILQKTTTQNPGDIQNALLVASGDFVPDFGFFGRQ